MDFGEKHSLFDETGNDPVLQTVYSVENGEIGMWNSMKGKIREGDYVEFRVIRGVREVERSPPYKVTAINSDEVVIEDPNNEA